jgi:hypothetical protein
MVKKALWGGNVSLRRLLRNRPWKRGFLRVLADMTSPVGANLQSFAYLADYVTVN